VIGDSTSMLAATPRIPNDVVYRTFAREVVVLNLRTGKYHGLNATGGRILEVLESAKNLEEAAEVLAAEYGRPLEDMQRDLCTFCRELLARELIELAA
jgi:hypothetical protein